MKQLLKLKVNEEEYSIWIEPWRLLLEVLRDELHLTGAKQGCNSGYCGVCTVLIDGKAVKSCQVLARQAEGKKILTIEGISHNGQLHPLQQAFLDHFVVQCGYCTSGMILTAKALLDENPSPTEDDVRMALSGVLCRCSGYVKITEAVLSAAEVMRNGGKK